MTNMAGGIRFGPGGRIFTPRGLNFVGDDGTCVSCTCDNPPGSGTNFGDCNQCPSNMGPASITISLTGIDLVDGTTSQDCGFATGVPHPVHMIAGTPATSLCLPGPTYFTSDCFSGTACGWSSSDVYVTIDATDCPPPPFGGTHRGFLVAEVWRQGTTWGVVVQGSFTCGSTGSPVQSASLIAFYGTATVPDCNTPFVVNNTIGGFGCTGSCNGAGSTWYAVGKNGTATVSPSFTLC